MCRQEGWPVSSMSKILKYTHQCIMVASHCIFTIWVHGKYPYMTLSNLMWPQWRDKPAWREHEWRWMRWAVGASWSCVAVTWRGDATWVNDHQITNNNAEIQKSTTEYSFQKEIRRNKNKTEGQKPQAAFCFRAPKSPALKWFASEIGGRGGGGCWQVSRDLLLCTLFAPLVNDP